MQHDEAKQHRFTPMTDAERKARLENAGQKPASHDDEAVTIGIEERRRFAAFLNDSLAPGGFLRSQIERIVDAKWDKEGAKLRRLIGETGTRPAQVSLTTEAGKHEQQHHEKTS